MSATHSPASAGFFPHHASGALESHLLLPGTRYLHDTGRTARCLRDAQIPAPTFTPSPRSFTSPSPQPLRHRPLPASFWQEPNVSARGVGGRPGAYPGYAAPLFPLGAADHPSILGHPVSSPSSSSLSSSSASSSTLMSSTAYPRGPVGGCRTKAHGAPVHKDFLERLQSAQTRGYDHVMAVSRSFPITHFLFYNYGLRSLFGMDDVTRSAPKSPAAAAAVPHPPPLHPSSAALKLYADNSLSANQLLQQASMAKDPGFLEQLAHPRRLQPSLKGSCAAASLAASASPKDVSDPAAAFRLQQQQQQQQQQQHQQQQITNEKTSSSMIFPQLEPAVLRYLDPAVVQRLLYLQAWPQDDALQHDPRPEPFPPSSSVCRMTARPPSLPKLAPLSFLLPKGHESLGVRASHSPSGARSRSASPTSNSRTGTDPPSPSSLPLTSASLCPSRLPRPQVARGAKSPERGQPGTDDDSPSRACSARSARRGAVRDRSPPPRRSPDCPPSDVLDLSLQQSLLNLGGQGPFPGALSFTFPALCPYLGYNCPNHRARGPHRFWDCVLGHAASLPSSASSLTSSSSSTSPSTSPQLVQDVEDSVSGGWKVGVGAALSARLPPFVNV